MVAENFRQEFDKWARDVALGQRYTLDFVCVKHQFGYFVLTVNKFLLTRSDD